MNDDVGLGISSAVKWQRCLKLPVIVILDRLDSPSELLPKCLGEELLNRNFEFLCKDDGEAWIDIILIICQQM
jgi:hypothetical protein